MILNNCKNSIFNYDLGNLIKNKIHHVFVGLFDTLSNKRKLTDAQMECMQFGICDYAPRQVEEVSFFHY